MKRKIQRQTAELFIKHCENEEARRVAISSEKKTVKIDRLVQLMFGQPPQKGEA